MRTSAPGGDCREDSRGFSLTELLVALAVVGLVSGAVVLVAFDRRNDVRFEAEMFAARLEGARDQAITLNRTVTILVSGQGYQFKVRTRGGWTELDSGRLNGAWNERTTVRLNSPAQELNLAFDPAGGASDAEFLLYRGNDEVSVRVKADGKVLLDENTGR